MIWKLVCALTIKLVQCQTKFKCKVRLEVASSNYATLTILSKFEFLKIEVAKQ